MRGELRTEPMKTVKESLPSELPASVDIRSNNFDAYRSRIMHQWLRTLTLLGSALVHLFFVFDMFMMPRELIVRFAVCRGVSTLLALCQLVMVRCTQSSSFSHVHGYFLSIQIGAVIALMTGDLGGFNSSCYAGVNLLMPWRAIHNGINVAIILVLYIGTNIAYGFPFDQTLLANNLFFSCSTGIISMCISLVRYRLIRNEFSLLVELQKARDALWSEMGARKTDTDRAATAVPTFFESAIIQSTSRGKDAYCLIDGAVFAQNPSLVAYTEARSVCREDFTDAREKNIE
jgi:hypothetical protein